MRLNVQRWTYKNVKVGDRLDLTFAVRWAITPIEVIVTHKYAITRPDAYYLCVHRPRWYWQAWAEFCILLADALGI